MARFSEQAVADLQRIETWIAQENPRLARQKAQLLADFCELLDAFPHLGAVYSSEIRHLTKQRWVIVYRPAGSGVYIYRIFDSSQDWQSELTHAP